MSDGSSSYATVDGRLIWCGGRGRWSVVGSGLEASEVWRFRSKSAARRYANTLRDLCGVPYVKVRPYRRRDVRISGRGYLEPTR